jgi:REP element-mobilizing transposase RayT
MSRKPRIHYPGALYHVILRGNAQDDVFYDDVDRTKFCLLVQEGTERFGHRVHAFCLLDNHIHAAFQVGKRPLSRIMQNLTFRYTQWFNRRHRRVGHLFQGRYKANLVDADSYLLELVRYIHLNPCRAGIPGEVEEYHWSSHRFYVGEEELPWLTTEFVLGQFSTDLGVARSGFRRFVADGIGADDDDNEFHPDRSDGRLIGDDQFIERVQEGEDAMKRDRRTLNDIIGSVCAAYNMKRTELSAAGKDRWASEARSMVALLVQEHPEITITEAAVILHRDTSSLTAGAARLRSRLARDSTLRDRLQQIKDNL